MQTSNQSSADDFSLWMLNLWIGLCRGVTGLPRLLRNLGFVDHAIEFRFQNSAGATVHPELILCSTKRGHSLLMEWKSGPNTDAEQLKRYAGVTPEDLRTRVYVPASAWSKHDIVVVGLAENVERLKKGIENGQHPFPLISVDGAGLALVMNTFELPDLNAGFSPLLAFDPTLAPRSFVPYGRHSPLHVVADKIIPSVLKAMHDRKSRVTAKGLSSDTVPTFDIMSIAQQNEIIKAVKTVMDQAAKGHFAYYLKTNRPAAGVAGPSWDITNNPLDLGVDKRSKEFQKLRKLQRLLLADLRAGISATEQLTFLNGEPIV